MKEYTINISVRHGTKYMPFGTYIVDNNDTFSELFRVSDLQVFKDDACLVMSIQEQEQEVAED